MLHELVHVWGKKTNAKDEHDGAYHTEREVDGVVVTPYCWDESRMASSAFLWAMAKRFPSCLTSKSTEFLKSFDDEWSACAFSGGGGGGRPIPKGFSPLDPFPREYVPKHDSGPVIVLDGAVLL